MAIYHASFQVIKRSAGRSSVAASAYRSGEHLIDKSSGEIHDYTKRSGVDSTFIMKPENAPDWVDNREELWSTVEKTERRKDAQLSRELNVALPKEISLFRSEALLRDYVQSSFIDKGMVADIAMHDMSSDNPHAHIMLTMRTIDGDGFGNKNRDWNDRKQLAEWREDWATAVNEKLQDAGQHERIDHRSLKEQGIERAPTIHLGPISHQMNKRGAQSDRYDRLEAIEESNRIEEETRAKMVVMREKVDEAIAALTVKMQEKKAAAEKLLDDAKKRLIGGQSESSLLRDVNDIQRSEAVELERERLKSKETDSGLKPTGPGIDI